MGLYTWKGPLVHNSRELSQWDCVPRRGLEISVPKPSAMTKNLTVCVYVLLIVGMPCQGTKASHVITSAWSPDEHRLEDKMRKKHSASCAECA